MGRSIYQESGTDLAPSPLAQKRVAQKRIATEVVIRAHSAPVATREERAVIGRVIGDRYRVDSLIARGAMGSVYLGTQLAFDRQIAIKLLDDPDNNKLFRKRFMREASVGSRLAHSNVVTIYDYGETDRGELFIAMEYIDGRLLSEELEKGPFQVPKALHIAIQIARALRKAHREKAVHRDLKPVNVMLQLQGDDPDFVKVLDFGLVKRFGRTGNTDPNAPVQHDQNPERGQSMDELTRAGAIMGTPGYMAPEQAVGEEIDGRADMYALGVLLFQMLTGRHPFEANSAMEMLSQHMTAPVPRVLSHLPTCPAPLDDLVYRCMQKAPAGRYESTDVLLVALKSIWMQVTDEPYGTEGSLLPDDRDSEEDKATQIVRGYVGPKATGSHHAPVVASLPPNLDRPAQARIETTLLPPAPAPRPTLSKRPILVFWGSVALLLAILLGLGILMRDPPQPDTSAPPAQVRPSGAAPKPQAPKAAPGKPAYKPDPYE